MLIGVVIVTLDVSLTSTAIPWIARSIGATPAKTIWIINVYYLAVVAGILPLGALGEIYGYKRVFLAGLITFFLGAVACGVASTLPSLMGARTLLGSGSAAVSATTPALIRSLYPPERLNRGLGLYAMVVGIALACGPTAASAVLAVADWPWLYLAMSPVALAAGALSIKSLQSAARSDHRFDGVASLLCACMFASLLFAIAGVAQLGRHHVAWSGAAFAAFAWALVRREAHASAPILAFDLFRIPLFSLSSATSVFATSIQGLG